MQISKEQFDLACAGVPLDPALSADLWRRLQESAPAVADTPAPPLPAHAVASRFDLAHLAYYFGAVIVLGAMGWFMTGAWEVFGGPGIFAIAGIYAVVFTALGRFFWNRPDAGLRTPGGLLVTLAVGMMPLMIYGLERWIGWWPADDPGDYARFHPFINASWVVMEVGTILAGAVALWFFRFPFLTAPISLALWYLSMDLTPLLFGRDEWHFEERLWVSMYFGLAMLAVAYVVDIRRHWTGPDYGFWLSLFGVLSFWFGLTLMNSDNEAGRAAYAAINVLMMVIGVILDRRVGVIFGAIGINCYIVHLAHVVFRDSLLFPFVLSLLGLLIIFMGVVFQRRRHAWRQAVVRAIPPRYAQLVPAVRNAA